MIKLLKNKEIRKTLLLQILIAVVACAVCFHYDHNAGNVAVVLSLLLILTYYISTYKRYKRISDLATDINKLLHGDNAISLENYSEGELGILHSEIYKMTIRLREQQQKLMNDKVYLADSIADISHQIRTPLTSIIDRRELLDSSCSFRRLSERLYTSLGCNRYCSIECIFGCVCNDDVLYEQDQNG